MSYQRGYSRWGARYAKEADAERKKRRAALRKSRNVKAHKRRQAGKVVHVKAYCRRPSSRGGAMPF